MRLSTSCVPLWHTGGGKAHSTLSLSLILHDKTHLMRSLGVPLLYWGGGRGPSRPSPLLLALTRALASEAWCHVGRQAAEVAQWRSLHEDLHAATQELDELAWEQHVATQVPAQLVGLAAACERRWELG